MKKCPVPMFRVRATLCYLNQGFGILVKRFLSVLIHYGEQTIIVAISCVFDKEFQFITHFFALCSFFSGRLTVFHKGRQLKSFRA